MVDQGGKDSLEAGQGSDHSEVLRKLFKLLREISLYSVAVSRKRAEKEVDSDATGKSEAVKCM